MYEETTEKLLEFIGKSPTAFQAARGTQETFFGGRHRIEGRGRRWELERAENIFVVRIIPRSSDFSIPVNDCGRYHIIASHSGSPVFLK